MSRVRLHIHYAPASLDPRMMGWPLRPDSLSGLAARPDFERKDGWYAWRLVGANNRELGRSVTTFPSYPECRDAATNVQKQIDHLSPCLLTDAASGRWTWRADIAGEPVASCQRWFDRERTCRASLGNFIDSIAAAEFAPDVTPLRDRGAPDPGRPASGGKP